MLRSFQELGRVSPGFETQHILTLRISGNYGETTNPAALTARINRTLEAIQATPGVSAVATAAALPGLPADAKTEVRLHESPADSRAKIFAESRFVSAAYFATMQIPLLAGAACRADQSYQSVLINQSFVNTYLPALQPIGRHIEFAVNTFNTPAAAITGIVADAHEQGLNQPSSPTIY